MDGHSHHDHQKRDLQVSKKGLIRSERRGGKEVNQRGKQGVSSREIALQVHLCVYIIPCVLSANNIDLCLGYK